MLKNDLEALALQALSLQLTRTTHCLGLFAGPALGRLFVGTAELHFTEDAFALHLLLQDLQGLVDIVVTNRDLHVSFYLIILSNGTIRKGSNTSPEALLLTHQIQDVKDRFGLLMVYFKGFFL